ncbi:MAG: pyruvate carboxylase, partial [Saprospiraceae bacterium]|nr:pyruvate carboxylase [Saprospiraceae bacterium]
MNRLLVANRGEIAIRILRAASELKIRTIALYTYEDRYSLHRFKADEAYQIGLDDSPLKPYLDVEEIIKTAKKVKADAIHPGYGFLSESVILARRCREEGITFVGPRPEVMEALGDKIASKKIAREAQVPVIEDNQQALLTLEIALQEAQRIDFPVIFKASAGGGGRGMRTIENVEQLRELLPIARRESKAAFGNDEVYLEKLVRHARHVEVQLLGDTHGNLVHLFERDCTVQRRNQKVVERAPAPYLDEARRAELCEYGLRIARHADYTCAGTVEFLQDVDTGAFYFIEVNPR